MADDTEGDSQYLWGYINGYLYGIAQRSDEVCSFDRERWTSLYGERVVYNSIPAWSSDEARDRGEEAVVICDWDEETETETLKPAAELPRDRPGELVFADGTTVIVRSGAAVMFTLDESETEYVERMDELHLELLREASEFYDKHRS